MITTTFILHDICVGKHRQLIIFNSGFCCYVPFRDCVLIVCCEMTLGYVQADVTLLDVTCCVRLPTLLHFVACCCAKYEPRQTSCKRTHNSQQCWELLANNVASFFTGLYCVLLVSLYLDISKSSED